MFCREKCSANRQTFLNIPQTIIEHSPICLIWDASGNLGKVSAKYRQSICEASAIICRYFQISRLSGILLRTIPEESQMYFQSLIVWTTNRNIKYGLKHTAAPRSEIFLIFCCLCNVSSFGCIAKASPIFTNASQIYHWSNADVISWSAICRRLFADHQRMFADLLPSSWRIISDWSPNNCWTIASQFFDWDC